MTELEIESESLRGSADILDELIRKIYKRLLNDNEENFKVGDLLKMIELRHKLAPSGAEQEKFWAILSKIRRDIQNNPATTDKLKGNGDKQKPAAGRIGRGEHNGE